MSFDLIGVLRNAKVPEGYNGHGLQKHKVKIGRVADCDENKFSSDR